MIRNLKSLIILICLSFCTACTGQQSTLHKGVFVDLFETSNFELCSSNEHWWLRADGPINKAFWNRIRELRSEYEAVTGSDGSPPFYLEASGTVTETVNYGHTGEYDGEFHVTSFYELRLATRDELLRCATSGFLPLPEPTGLSEIT